MVRPLDWAISQPGIPQDSALDPLLFLMYITDFIFQSSEVRLFADNTVLYIIIDNPVDSADILNDDSERHSLWAEEWIVKAFEVMQNYFAVTRWL